MENISRTKVFLFRFYILCENFSKIGPIMKKWGGGKGSPNLIFSVFIFINYLFIYSSNTSLFSILLVCEEC